MRINDIRISPHFKLYEFEDTRTHEVKIDPTLLCNLELIRLDLRSPLFISSGYRTKKTNGIVKGKTKSRHLQGKAADIYSKTHSLWELKYICEKYKFRAVIPYPDMNFIHVDVK